jgi:hypothetical protein
MRRSSNVKTVDEDIIIVFNFLAELALGETITSASVAATVYTGTDASPAAVISGAAEVAGAEVSQLTTGGLLGVVYLLQCTVNTSDSQVLIQSAFLAIVPPENV